MDQNGCSGWTRICNRDYFAALYKDCSSRDVQAAFLYQMQTRDLTGWHSGDIPDSIGLRAQRYLSMNNVQKWLGNALSNETLNDTFGEWQEKISSSELFRLYSQWCDSAKAGEYRRLDQVQVSKYLSRLFPKVNHVGGRGQRGFVLGTLEDAIAKFEKYEKVSLSELGDTPDTN